MEDSKNPQTTEQSCGSCGGKYFEFTIESTNLKDLEKELRNRITSILNEDFDTENVEIKAELIRNDHNRVKLPPLTTPTIKGSANNAATSKAKAISTAVALTSSTTNLATTGRPTCYAGIASGEIPISSITASSFHQDCWVTNAPLNSSVAWCAGHSTPNNPTDWLQVDLETPTKITGIATQGRFNCCHQFVRTYKISYGNDATELRMYEENGTVKIFPGNSDKNTIVKNYFLKPIIAIYFRIYPVTYNEWMSMRIELLKC
ncbi:lactadherin-like [Styela clava]